MDDEKRCTATSHRTGKRCGLARIPGTTVCATHGGKAPQVRDAAAARVADTQARELAHKMNVDPAQFRGDPIDALRDLLARDQAEMERYARLAARFEDSELTYRTKGGAEMLRAVLGAYQSERDALGRRLDLMLKAGVAQRMVEAREAQTRTNQQGTVALFGLCLTLFIEDVSWALASAGAFEFHDSVMSKLQHRVQFRLAHEQSMILTQVENMARQDPGRPARNGQEPR